MMTLITFNEVILTYMPHQCHCEKVKIFKNTRDIVFAKIKNDFKLKYVENLQ